MNKKTKTSTKGITLIALVITIIVMLILVAVTISMAVNGGLFDYASKATKDTKSEINREKKLADLQSGMSTDDLIEYFTTEPDIHSWTREGDTFTCSHCNASYTMGDVVDYSPTTATTLTVSGQDRGVSEGITAGKLTAGDFGTGGSQALSQEPSREPSQEPSEDKLTWIVFGLDKNGSLLITTQTPTVGTLTLYGKKAYVNGPSIMNNVCEKLYSNSTYGKARSITIEDVNLAVNWEDTRGMVSPVSGDPYKVNKGTKFGDVEETTGDGKMKAADWDAIKNNNQTPETGKSLTDYEINGYYYKVARVEGATALEYNTILAGDNPYWLASRGVGANSFGGYARFGPGAALGGNAGSYGGLFGSDGLGDFGGFGLRPVVSLKSELPNKVNP